MVPNQTFNTQTLISILGRGEADVCNNTITISSHQGLYLNGSSIPMGDYRKPNFSKETILKDKERALKKNILGPKQSRWR
jgi:hypothetical protein